MKNGSMNNKNIENINPNETRWKIALKEITDFKNAELGKIKLSAMIKPTLISFAALIVSMFLDISFVPLLGHVTIDIAKTIFPNWTPVSQVYSPLSFWWLPILFYLIFLLMGFKVFRELKIEAKLSTSRENIDRIIAASISVVDGLATALPLIGAAILLISIKLGPEIFLGFSVPFEIKALIVLAIGKLYEPVLDELGVIFQNVVNKAIEKKENFVIAQQIESIQKLASVQERQNIDSLIASGKAPADFEKHAAILQKLYRLSEQTYKNFGAAYQVMKQMNELLDNKEESIRRMTEFSDSITQMTLNMNNENVQNSLSSLESIINKR